MPRDYKKEASRYNHKPTQIKRRSSRNKARDVARKKFGAAAIKGKDVIHKDGNPMNNAPSNLGLASPSKNRSFKRTTRAGKKNPRD